MVDVLRSTTGAQGCVGDGAAPRVSVAFIVIGLGFGLAAGVGIYDMRQTQSEVKLITKDAAVDIELATRLSRNRNRE